MNGKNPNSRDRDAEFLWVKLLQLPKSYRIQHSLNANQCYVKVLSNSPYLVNASSL